MMAIAASRLREGQEVESGPLVTIRGLKTYFRIRSGLVPGPHTYVRAVDGVDLDITAGETLALVGESGCGKSTLGRTIVRLIEPTAGQVIFDGRDLARLSSRQLRRIRRDIGIIFQDPFASLDPRQTVDRIIGEPLDIHRVITSRRQRRERIAELLDLVGLNPRYAERYPHEFSGGQRQRIGIARALALEPKFIVCDEPISALDVSIQAQIINLLERLQAQFKLTYLFIAHDLSVVRHMADRVAVMYLGKIVELAATRELYTDPKHPYTASLLSAVPVPDPQVERQRQRIILTGDVPSPTNPPSGCRFRTRCFKAQERCGQEVPAVNEFQAGEHQAACFYTM